MRWEREEVRWEGRGEVGEVRWEREEVKWER